LRIRRLVLVDVAERESGSVLAVQGRKAGLGGKRTEMYA
jgi:hypothetical protein